MQGTTALPDFNNPGEQEINQGRSGHHIQVPDTPFIGSSPSDSHLIPMDESALYYRLHNLLIKFDGLYWYWSPKQESWIIDQHLAIEHSQNRNFIEISEEEADKYIVHSGRIFRERVKIEG